MLHLRNFQLRLQLLRSCKEISGRCYYSCYQFGRETYITKTQHVMVWYSLQWHNLLHHQPISKNKYKFVGMEYSKRKYWANCITTIDKGIFAPDSKISWHKKVLETILFWHQILLQNSGKIIVWIWDIIYVMTRESNVVTSCTPTFFFFEKETGDGRLWPRKKWECALAPRVSLIKQRQGFPADLRGSTQRESYIFWRTKGSRWSWGVELLFLP